MAVLVGPRPGATYIADSFPHSVTPSLAFRSAPFTRRFTAAQPDDDFHSDCDSRYWTEKTRHFRQIRSHVERVPVPRIPWASYFCNNEGLFPVRYETRIRAL